MGLDRFGEAVENPKCNDGPEVGGVGWGTNVSVEITYGSTTGFVRTMMNPDGDDTPWDQRRPPVGNVCADIWGVPNDLDDTAHDWVDVGTSDWSGECWFRYHPPFGFGTTWPNLSYNSTQCMLVGFFGTVGESHGIILAGSTVAAKFSEWGGATYNCTGTLASLNGQWQHLAVTMDRDGLMSLYIDGVAVGTVDISGSAAYDVTGANAGRRYAHINGYPVGGTRNFYTSGFMAGWAFHRRVLTAAEIRAAWIGRKMTLTPDTEHHVWCAHQQWDFTTPFDPNATDNNGTIGFMTNDASPYVGHGMVIDGWNRESYTYYRSDSTSGPPANYMIDWSAQRKHVLLYNNGGIAGPLMTFDDTWSRRQ